MQINLNVKVKGGKRTPVSVEVYGTSVNEKMMEFANGKKVSEAALSIWLKEQLTIALKKMQGEI